MSEELFRTAALAHQGERLWGDLILSQPLSVRVLTTFLAALTLGALLFLALNHYQRKVAVTGMLVPDSGLIEVPAPIAGTITAVHVRQHQHVGAGAPLFTVELDHTLRSGHAVSTQLLQALAEQARSLEQQRMFEQQNQSVLERGFKDGLGFAQQRLQQALILVSQSRELLGIRQRQHARAVQLQRQGMLAAADVESSQAQLLQQEQALQQALSQQQQAEAAAAELQRAHDARMLQGKRDLQRLHAELAQLEEQRIRLSADQSTVIVAPVAGEVSHLMLQSGMTVRAQQQVLTLLPESALLQAELQVPSSAIGFVGEGQRVSLRFDAFPYQKFGVQQGRIRSIAASSDVSANAAGRPQALYKLVASLDKQSITAYGREAPLRAGMSLNADVVVDERSLFEWLLEPLYSIRGR